MAHTVKITLRGRYGSSISLDDRQILDATGFAVYLDAEDGTPRILLELAPTQINIEGTVEQVEATARTSTPTQSELLALLARGLDQWRVEERRRVSEAFRRERTPE